MDPSSVMNKIVEWTGRDLDHQGDISKMDADLFNKLNRCNDLKEVINPMRYSNDEQERIHELLKADIAENLILKIVALEAPPNVKKIIPYDTNSLRDLSELLSRAWYGYDREYVLNLACKGCPVGKPNKATLVFDGMKKIKGDKRLQGVLKIVYDDYMSKK